MCRVALSIPEEILYDTKMSAKETEDFVRKAVAIRYYTTKKISLGYCADIAGMSKTAFIKLLGENGISIFQFDSLEELAGDVANA